MTQTSTTRILDLLTTAAHAAIAAGSDPEARRQARLEVFAGTTQDERVAFDLFLVAMGDELAFQDGPVEERFAERAGRMAEAFEVWKARLDHNRDCLAAGDSSDCPVCIQIRARS